MGIFNKLKNQFDSSELKCKKSHIRNLYKVALCDGKIDNNEFDLILYIGKNKLFLDGRTIQDVFNNSEDIDFYVPKNDSQKINYLQDYVKLSMIDGEINQREITVCKHFATSFGFRTVIVDKLFEAILSQIVEGVAKDIALQRAFNELEK